MQNRFIMLESCPSEIVEMARRGEPMDDQVREQLVTLGQRIEGARFEREVAIDEVRELVASLDDSVRTSEVAELTTLPEETVAQMRR
jgi:chemotaxis regulatin CheY-phosphate phosphatase CheZ